MILGAETDAARIETIFLKNFHYQKITRYLFHYLNGISINLSLIILHWIFDSSVLTRYGEQEGAARGYNPSKPGRKSHHPLMAFVDG